MAVGEKIATLKIKAQTVSQAGAKIQKKYVFTISEVKELLETSRTVQSASERQFYFFSEWTGQDKLDFSFYIRNAE